MPDTQVALVNMPFGNLVSPSIGLGLLKAALTQAGIKARTFHFERRFAELIGEQNYERIYSRTHTEHLAGEYIFTSSLFGVNWGADVSQYLNEVLKRPAKGCKDKIAYSEPLLEKIEEIIISSREQVEGFLEDCLSTILAEQPRVVGFTSLFHQHVASLSLAKRIKEKSPDTFIVFGGSNCEGPMGLETFQQFAFIDALVSGEGEFVFPKIVRQVLNSQRVPELDGVYSRGRTHLPIAGQSFRNTPIIENLDNLPVPDYDEYFEQPRREWSGMRRPTLLFETSRGCWWGEKQHCTFCGLNGDSMVYRSKSAIRAFEEFIYLTGKYPVSTVSLVDNILDMNYFKSFIPLLAEQKHGVKLFYELKANLRKDQLQLLREAGIGEIQPGIESLSDNVLRIMRKGVSALQNIQLLKWCRELQLKPYYNLLWGFPGERSGDYAEMTRLVPLITHLEPPIGEGIIRIDRFSPNFEQGDSLGFKKLSPHPAYSFVYPFASEVLFNLAYFFTGETGNIDEVSEYTSSLVEQVKTWKDCHSSSDLFFIEKEKHLLIWDFRPVAKERLTVLKGAEKFCYLACDQIATPRQVAESWKKQTGEAITEGDAGSMLDSLTERGLMVRRKSSYLALAYSRTAESIGGKVDQLRRPNGQHHSN